MGGWTGLKGDILGTFEGGRRSGNPEMEYLDYNQVIMLGIE